jgi:hypothetical protein
MRTHFARRILLHLLLISGNAIAQTATPPVAEARWYKGNLHTHTLWSNGDDYPEMVADWYKKNGYHFLAISDGNVLHQGARWHELKAPLTAGGYVNHRGGGPVLEKYLARFGADWVELRQDSDKRIVRLKPMDEYRPLLEEAGRFLLLAGEEVTSTWRQPKAGTSAERFGPLHINVTNLRDAVKPIEADNAVNLIQRTLETVREQRNRTGQMAIVQISHPNYQWGVTAEEVMQVKDARLIEIYNGDPESQNAGDATRLGTEAMWDAILTQRLTELRLGPVFGLAVDDAHHFHATGAGMSSPGRGWIMVRAKNLTPESILTAIDVGDFYASTGVVLRNVVRVGDRLAVSIQAEPGVTYRTQFVGTRRGYTQGSHLMTQPAKETEPRRTMPHRRYSKDVGMVLTEIAGTNASYTLKGDEFYVRARIISSKRKPNGSVAGEYETAWTQPLINPQH